MAIRDRQKLITNIVSHILNEPAQIEKKFEWLINKHIPEHFKERYTIIDNIFNSLHGDIIANQNKGRQALRCDAYFGGLYNFIFEFDERQHFSSPRLKTLNFYPKNLNLNYNIDEWKHLCLNYQKKANNFRRLKRTVDFHFEGGRTSQRAYLDSFKDFLPEIHGLNPTLRINEFEVSDILTQDKESYIKIEKILNNKLQ